MNLISDLIAPTDHWLLSDHWLPSLIVSPTKRVFCPHIIHFHFFLFLLLCKICLHRKIDFRKSNSKWDEIASVGNSVRSQISLSCSCKRCRFLLISALLKASREEKWRYIQVVQSERKKSRCHNFNSLQKSVLIFQLETCIALVLLQKWPCPTFAKTGGTQENGS